MIGIDGIEYGPGGNMPNMLSRRSNELAHKVADNLSNALSEARSVAASRTRIFNSGMIRALERIKSMIDPNRLLPHMLKGIQEFESDVRNPNAVESEDVAYDSDDYDTQGEFLDDFRWLTSEGQMEMEASLLQFASRQAKLMDTIMNKLKVDFNASVDQMRVYFDVTSRPDSVSESMRFGHEMSTNVLIFFSTLISKYLTSVQSMRDDIRKMGRSLNTSRKVMVSFLVGMDELYKSRNIDEDFEMATDTFFRDLDTDNYKTDRSDPRSIITRKGGFAFAVLHGERLYDFGKSALVELIQLFHPIDKVHFALGETFLKLANFEMLLNKHLAQIAMLLTYKGYA